MENGLRGEFRLSSAKDASPHAHNSTKKAHNRLHFFSSHVEFPDGISFAEQKENERVELLVRKHFVTNVPWIFLSIFLIFLPVTIPVIEASLPISFPSLKVQTLILFAYYLFIFGFVLLNFTLWYFHTGIITNLRVVDIDITGILIREVSEGKNEDIQDVTHSQIGFIRSLFNYGDVLVQTSGSLQNIEFDRIPKPAHTARILADLTRH